MLSLHLHLVCIAENAQHHALPPEYFRRLYDTPGPQKLDSASEEGKDWICATSRPFGFIRWFGS